MRWMMMMTARMMILWESRRLLSIRRMIMMDRMRKMKVLGQMERWREESHEGANGAIVVQEMKRALR